MHNLDRGEFKRLIGEFLGTWKLEANEFQLGTWWAALQRFDLPNIRRVLTRVASEWDGKQTPRPAYVAQMLHKAESDRGGNGCQECRALCQTARMAHWLSMPADEARAHVGSEFGKNGEHLHAQIEDYRRRYTCKIASPSGQWLAPDIAFTTAMYSGPSMGRDFETFHAQHVRQHDLRRRPDESRRAFARRCIAAAGSGGFAELAKRLAEAS